MLNYPVCDPDYPYLHSASANKNVHSPNASRTTHLETQFQTIPAHMLSESSSADMRSDIRLTLTLNPNPALEVGHAANLDPKP